MKNTTTKGNLLTTSPVRVTTIIVLTVVVVIAAVALFSVLAKNHGGVPYEQQTHLKILGITKFIKQPDDPNPLHHEPPGGYDQLHMTHPLVVLSESFDQVNFNGPLDSNKIRSALTYTGRIRKSDLMATGKVSVTQEPDAQFSASDDPVWRETRQWCVRLTPTSDSAAFDEALWQLSSVKGARTIMLQPEARYLDGFLLPVQSNAYGRVKGKMSSVFWTLADPEICAASKAFVRNTARADSVKNEKSEKSEKSEERSGGLEEALTQIERQRESTWRIDAHTELKNQQLSDYVNRQNQLNREANSVAPLPVTNEQRLPAGNRSIGSSTARVQQAVYAVARIKAAVTQHFKQKGKWPNNNFEADLPSPNAYLNSADRSGVRVVSISVEPNASTSSNANSIRIQIRYLNERDEVQRLFFHAPVSGAEPQAWECISPDMKDIAEFVSTCRYSVR
jgi:hypothetical protein